MPAEAADEVVATQVADAAPKENSAVLEEIFKSSVSAWQKHLKSSFRHAKDRFGDVVMEVNESIGKERDHSKNPTEVWVHKAILYSRVPAWYREQYFPRKDGNGASPLPYATVSASVPSQWQDKILAMHPELFDTSHASCLLRLTVSKFDEVSLTGILRSLYAENKEPKGKASLSDATESNIVERRLLSGLQADLLFAWRARINSDVRIVLHEDDVPVYTFWSHRFLLASRSPYFKSVLAECAVSEKAGPASDEVLALSLPSSTFTPPALLFILGFIYTGTLNFMMKRSYDLGTAFSIFKGSQYLNMPTLTAEVRARLVEEMMHGLFHAYVGDEEYELRVSQKWNAIAKSGCPCRECSRRIPRVLEFALREDVLDEVILRGVRRATIALFGEGWCIPEFGALPRPIKEYAMKDIKRLVTAVNVFPLLFKAEAAFAVLETRGSWDNDLQVADMFLDVSNALDQLLFTYPDSCFESEEWTRVMKDWHSDDEIRMNRAEREFGWMLKALSRCEDSNHAHALCHSLSQLLLVPSRNNEFSFPLTSNIQNKIEKAMAELSAIINSSLGSRTARSSTPQPESQLDVRYNVSSTRSRSSSTSSIYSNISTQLSAFSIEELDPAYRAYPVDLDTGNISLYSYPSSRTISTDYGLFYTRLALSTDSIGGFNSNRE